jgi:phosphoribosyl-dephospho-CoA transferase
MKPHDLLWVPTTSLTDFDGRLPTWLSAKETVVVVRRDRHDQGRIPVGVRGQTKEERLAAFVPPSCITHKVTPYDLVRGKAWLSHPALGHHPVLLTVQQVAPVLDAMGLPWGITGSLGFELATGVPCLHAKSDLDLVIDAPTVLDRSSAQVIAHALSDTPCRWDIQIETPMGAVALAEWARHSAVLVKTNLGPCLTESPWHSQWEASA